MNKTNKTTKQTKMAAKKPLVLTKYQQAVIAYLTIVPAHLTKGAR